LALDGRLGYLKSADDIRIFREGFSSARADRTEIMERGARLNEAAPCDEIPSDDPCEHSTDTTVVARGEASEANLHRVETAVSWLQNEVEACRLPRAAPLPLVPGLPVMEPVIDRSTLDPTLQRLPVWLQERQTRPQSPPPREGGVFWPRAVNFLIACGIAAPLYYIAVVTSPLHMHLAEVAELPPPTPTVPGPPRDGLSQSLAGPESASAQQAALAPEPTVAPPASPKSPPAATVVAEGNARSSSLAPERASVPATKIADLQDVKLLIDRGEQFFDVGDLVAARILLLRAVIAGDAEAAVALGATYDPIILAGRGVRADDTDLDKARSWYERAKEMGSPEGPRRLEMLANR